MPETLRFLVVESEPPAARVRRRARVGTSSGETYLETLQALVPGAACDLVRPADADAALPAGTELAGYDAVFLTGSPLHLYQDTPDVRRQMALMREVFASGTPSFGSCAGLQLATVAAGGTVRPNVNGYEAGIARAITPTGPGRTHPLLAGRPPAFDALSIHSDEVDALPDGGIVLATNANSRVQAAEIRSGPGVFWGVQYHPELSLLEIAEAIRRDEPDLLEDGLVSRRQTLRQQADLIEALHAAPQDPDLAWRLGVDREVTERERRQQEITNFIQHQVKGRRR